MPGVRRESTCAILVGVSLDCGPLLRLSSEGEYVRRRKHPRTEGCEEYALLGCAPDRPSRLRQDLRTASSIEETANPACETLLPLQTLNQPGETRQIQIGLPVGFVDRDQVRLGPRRRMQTQTATAWPVRRAWLYSGVRHACGRGSGAVPLHSWCPSVPGGGDH